MQCPKCGYERQAGETTPDYECPKCGVIYAKYDPAVEQRHKELIAQRQAAAQEAADRARRIASAAEAAKAHKAAEIERLERMCITTTPHVPGREVDFVIELITSECAFGMNIFKDFFTSMTDKFGGRSNSTQNTLRDARRVVIRELRTEAFELGADAVIGVDLNYSEFSGAGKSMLFVVATGTAVKLKPAA